MNRMSSLSISSTSCNEKDDISMKDGIPSIEISKDTQITASSLQSVEFCSISLLYNK